VASCRNNKTRTAGEIPYETSGMCHLKEVRGGERTERNPQLLETPSEFKENKTMTKKTINANAGGSKGNEEKHRAGAEGGAYHYGLRKRTTKRLREDNIPAESLCGVHGSGNVRDTSSFADITKGLQIWRGAHRAAGAQ